MALGKLPVPGCPTYFDLSRATAYCAYSRCGLFGHFYARLSFVFSFSLSLGDGWLVGCFGFSGPLRQYFSLYRAVSQREGGREEKE